MTRKGDWMQTYTGGAFWPLDPLPEEVRIEDIAHALSMQCRYGGHSLRFYSVAEHCIHVASRAPKELKLAALMHDASEAYLVDVPRPLKRFLPDYKAYEEKVEKCIAERYSLPWPMPKEIKALDDAIIADERIQNMGASPFPWSHREPLGVELQFWAPPRGRDEFLSAFYLYRSFR